MQVTNKGSQKDDGKGLLPVRSGQVTAEMPVRKKKKREDSPNTD